MRYAITQDEPPIKWMSPRSLSALLALLLAWSLPAQEALEPAQEAQAGKREKEQVESVLTFDLGWLLHGFTNSGIALGINYERLIVPHFSLRGMVGGMFFDVPALDAYAIDVTLSLFGNWYPLSRMLDWLYVGLGITADILFYFGGAALPSPPVDSFLSIAPTIGWKQNIANVVVLDFFGGYSFLVFNTQRFRAEEYIRSGVQLGIRFKILWRPGKSKGDLDLSS